MKLFAKIFICSMLVLSIAVLFSGYLLITYSYKGAVNRETERALSQYQYNKFSIQAQLIANAESSQGDVVNDKLLSALSSGLNGEAAFFSEDKALLFSNLTTEVNTSLLNATTYNTISYEFQKTNGKVYLTISGILVQGNISIYLLTATDISPVIIQKESMVQSFKKVYFITIAVSIGFVLILSAFLTRPIKKLTKAATQIAHGQYHKRLIFRGGDEIAELSSNFNLMSEAIENKVNELSANARQKEDFVASFAHELKTPLTSVIGYADMLYQKNLPTNEVKNAAWYILNEGLRLEALSLKLMDLIILNKQNFILEEMQAHELLQDISDSLKPLFNEKQVNFHLEADSAYVNVECDLFKTLLLNLIDNSMKAGCKDVWISGEKTNTNTYHVSVCDNGRGIPSAELSRITEAFYMVDKSRSRKQHGVGLGLALASRIANIHGGSLKFHSEENKYTIVEFDLSSKEGENYA